MKRVLYWHRKDLRLHDNRCLLEACEHEVLPVYIFDTYHQQTQHGHKRMGARRAEFILESLKDLKASYKELGTDLFVYVGKPKEILQELIQKHRIDEILTQELPGVHEQEQLEIDFPIKTYDTHTLYRQKQLTFELPNVFTKFYQKTKNAIYVDQAFAQPTEITAVSTTETTLPTLQQLGYKQPIIDERSQFNIEPGEQAAIKYLQTYMETDLSTYKHTRNQLENGSSMLSAYLAHGCLSVRYVYHQIREYEKTKEKNESTKHLRYELHWREYCQHIMYAYGPKLFCKTGLQEQAEWKDDQKLTQTILNANTNIPFIDAAITELTQTGYLSNRARQNLASYWSKHAQLDWRAGAALFQEHLIDYDVANNTFNWLYVSGVGLDPRDRIFNPIKQARQYDTQGEWVKKWVPELLEIDESVVHTPWKAGKSEPIVLKTPY